MNLLDEDFSEKKGKNTNITMRIILICIVLLVICIIGIFIYMMYLESQNLKVVLNGQQNADVKNLLVIEADGTVYVPVRAISSYLGYNCYNGEYSNKSEDTSKCYVQCEEEAVNLVLNSNKVYKLNLEKQDDNYTYIYMDNPVRAMNGELYISADGMEKVFNTSFQYDTEKNEITMYTSTYLLEQYATTILDYGYTELSDNFENNKAVMQDMLVVTDDKNFGVINASDGTEVLECKYDDIIYQEATGDFIVCSDSKYGIIGQNRKTKVNLTYDSISLMDYDAELYLVEKDNKYGVIDFNGNSKIYVEYDKIGVDISKFEENDLKTGYLLINNLIPVMKNDKWGLFDKNGNQVVDFEYDSFGYIASNNKEAVNLLVIPDYNVIVACVEEKYTLLNASGEQPFKALVDDIYMTISGGEKSYVMTANDKTYDVEDYLDRLGVRNTNTTTNTSNNVSTEESNNQTNNEENGNDGQQESEQQNDEQQSDEQQDNQEETTE